MELTEVLRGGRQCDEDGVEIIMSRQACCEAADELDRLRAALKEAVSLRVALWRNGDFEGDDDMLSDDQIARKDCYAKKWLAALTPNVEANRAPATR